MACGEALDAFLHREYLDPLQADVFMGTPPEQDARIATLYPGSTAGRVGHMLWAALRGGSTEANVARSFLAGGHAKQAFSNPPPQRPGHVQPAPGSPQLPGLGLGHRHGTWPGPCLCTLVYGR